MPFLYIVFWVLKVLFIKYCEIQPPNLLFLVTFISFYINRYHFSQIFKTSFSIIWKKYFCHKFSFFNRVTEPPSSLPPPYPTLNIQNPRQACMTRVFCWCSLTKEILYSIWKVLHHLYISYIGNVDSVSINVSQKGWFS